jgi:hypothetical protein
MASFIVYEMSGLPHKGFIFFLIILLEPPRAGVIAIISITQIYYIF